MRVLSFLVNQTKLRLQSSVQNSEGSSGRRGNYSIINFPAANLCADLLPMTFVSFGILIINLYYALRSTQLTGCFSNLSLVRIGFQGACHVPGSLVVARGRGGKASAERKDDGWSGVDVRGGT